ncbi:accessory gene regulator ArgB-like protein [Paenibacillus solisilvae]|uniref:Accessory gene regulator ArgB-like protein n=1 Tax=Paenibacillus solisilvae TaxID=2486751 RepID=A0ABW0W5N3_9BACL
MINSLAQLIAVRIKLVVPDHPASVNVLRYSISFFLNALFIILLSLLIALLTHRVPEAGIVLVAFAALRQVSGGAHLKSGTLCVVVSTAIITVLSFMSFMNDSSILWTNLASLLLVSLFAPSRIEQQTRIKETYYPLLKILSIVMVGSNFLIGSSVLAATFLAQSLTLIRQVPGRR